MTYRERESLIDEIMESLDAYRRKEDSVTGCSVNAMIDIAEKRVCSVIRRRCPCDERAE